MSVPAALLTPNIVQRSPVTRATIRPQPARRVLILGGAGYLGSVMVGQLLRHGFAVRVLDAFLFGDRSLNEFQQHPDFEVAYGDVRSSRAAKRSMSACDAVIHLAAIVGDSACDKQKDLALEVNCTATPMLADAARESGVHRFMFASSCSVYGVSEGLLDESAPLKPLSLYAQTKQNSERALLAAKASDFAPTILRLGTLFGLSPRMRFDLIVNMFVAQAASSGRITVWNGEQWRPFLHVHDAVCAFMACLNATPASVSGQIFNVGSPALNCQIRTLGEEVVQLIPDTRLCTIENEDRRNYRVSFEKIQNVLGFRCRKNLAFGIEEIYASLRSRTATDLTAGRFMLTDVHEKAF